VSSTFSTNTTVTIAVNTDYTIANAAISSNQYSYVHYPVGYPNYFNYTTTLTKPTGMTGTPSGTVAIFQVFGGWVHLRLFWALNGGGSVTGNSWSASLPINSINDGGRFIGAGVQERVGVGFAIIQAFADQSVVLLFKSLKANYTTGDEEYDIDMWYPFSTT
jgi:hypothetical protein